MQIVDSIENIRRRPDMFLPFGQLSAASLLSCIATEALILAETSVRCERRGDWWIAMSEFDWLSTNSITHPIQYFQSTVPFPQAGQNSHFGEIVLAAYCPNLVTVGAGEFLLIRGAVSQDLMQFLDGYRAAGRAVAFSIIQDK